MHVRPLTLALVATLSLAGCSGGGEPSVRPGSATSPPTAAVAAAGVETTPAGTELALGEAGTVAWQLDAETTGTVEVAVEQVRRESARVLAGWVPQDEVFDTTPYFVTATVTNAGEGDLAGAAMPLYLRDTGGTLAPAATFGSDFTACPSTPLPDPFAPGATAEVCLVFTLPPEAEPDAMTFQPTSTELGVAWSVE